MGDASKTDKDVALIVLSAVNNLKIGENKLAAFLKGSKSKLAAQISEKMGYGGLYWLDIDTIKCLIEQLVEKGFIIRQAQYDFTFPYPALVLAEEGRRALEGKSEIPLQIMKNRKSIVISESEMKTLELLRQGKSIREICALRELAESTVYTHCYRLIINKNLMSAELIPRETIKNIRNAINKFEAMPPLKVLKAILPENITYGEIRCALADKENILRNDYDGAEIS